MLGNQIIYSPVLRLKGGEISAAVSLAGDVKRHIAPIWVSVPPNDLDGGRYLSPEELVKENGRRVAKAWGNADCLLDVRYLRERLGFEASERWIPQVFSAALSFGAQPGVVVDCSAQGAMLRGYRSAVMAGADYIACRITLADLQDPLLEVRITAVLGAIERSAENSVAILDLGDADISVPAIAADVIEASYERIARYARWRKVVVVVTSYPNVNPAPEGKLVSIPRTEPEIWERLLGSGVADPSVAIVGDFGPDCSEFEFGGGLSPIPHYRYSTSSEWLVSRGIKSLKRAENVAKMAKLLVSDDRFMGASYSFGDGYISDSSRGRVVGGAREWRAANVNHHLEMVLRRLAAERGISMAAPLQKREQLDFFSEANQG